MPRTPRTTPRKKPRQERAQATVAALLEATAQVLVRDGYDRASTNRIALAAGVSIGSLYQYFPTKEALVGALVDKHMADLLAVLRGATTSLAQASLPVAARELIGALVACVLVEPKLNRILYEQVPRVGRLRDVMDLLHREATGIAHAYLVAHRDEIRPTDLPLAAFLVVMTVDSALTAAMYGNQKILEDGSLERELTELVVRYLART
jgi:AcrR family transcriptional regulator